MIILHDDQYTKPKLSISFLWSLFLFIHFVRKELIEPIPTIRAKQN